MKKILFLLLLLAFIASCATTSHPTNSPKKVTTYPHWFIHPEDTVVGYSPVYFTTESSVKEGTKNAIDNYLKFNYCVVMGIQTYIQTPSGLDLVYDSLFIHVNEAPNDDTFLDKKFAHADTFATYNMIIVGYSNNPIENEKTELFAEKVPWIESPPQDNNFHYAIGSTSKIFSEYKAWEQAENNAIMNLARQIAMEDAIEVLINKDQMMSKFNEEVNVELRNIQIIERWKDPHTNTYYVLIRM